MTPKELSPGCVLHFNGSTGAKHISLILSYSLKENKCIYYFVLSSIICNKQHYLECKTHFYLPTIVLEETYDTVLTP